MSAYEIDNIELYYNDIMTIIDVFDSTNYNIDDCV